MTGVDQSGLTVWMEPLAWSVLHSLWQVLVIALFYAIGLAVTKRVARERQVWIRYVGGCVALVMMATAPIVTFVFLLPVDRVESSISRAPLAIESVPVVVTEQPNSGFESLETAIEPAPVVVDTPEARSGLQITWLAIAWLVGVAVAAIRPICGLHRVRQLKRSACELPDIATVVHEVARRLGVRRAVACLSTPLTDVPVLIGHFRPVILVPLSLTTGLDSSQLECLLVHELAHVRRHDYVVNSLQVVIETLLFFHPVVWWVSHRIRIDREFCTDDLALSITGSRTNYVAALLKLEHCRQPTLPAVAATGGSLLNRVERLTQNTNVRLPIRRGNTVSVVVVLTILALLFGLTRAHLIQRTNPTSQDLETPMPQNDELIAATIAGDLNRVKELIEAGADPNSVDANGMGTLLNFHPEVTRYLLEQGADPDIQRNENILPVLVGVAGFNTECVKLMLDAGANPNISSDHNGETALHHAGSDLELVRILLEAGADPNARTKPGMTTYALWRDARVRGETPLHRAAAWGSPEVIQLLLDGGADPAIRDVNNDTPLSWASWHQRDKSIIDQLAYDNSGVGPDIAPVIANDAATAEFFQAVVANDVAKVKAMLTENASLANTDCRPIEKRDGRTDGFPLVQACQDGNVELIKLLLDHGANIDTPSPGDDEFQHARQIFSAFERRDYKLVHLLLDRGASVDPHPCGYIGLVDFALRRASEEEDKANAETIERIIRSAFNSQLTRANSGQPHPEVSLESLGDAPETVRLLARFVLAGGKPTLWEVARQQHMDLIQELLEYCPNAPAGKYNALGNSVHGETVFVNLCGAAGWGGYPDLLTLCVETCPQLYHTDLAKRSIQYAISSHNRDGEFADYRRLIVSQLEYLKQNGEMTTPLTYGALFLPLHLLADDFIEGKTYGFRCKRLSTEEELINLAQLFVDYGFDVNTKHPESGLTPLEVAREKKRTQYAVWLLKHGAKEQEKNVSDVSKTDPPKLPRYQEIFQAVKDGDSDRVLAMIEADDALLNIADHNQSTPLTRAFAYKHFDIAHLLIERGANVFAMNHSDKWPMRSIVEKGGLPQENRTLFVEAAIAAGACDAEIFHAVWRGDHNRVQAILDGDPAQASLRHADPNGANGFYNGLPYCGLTPLHYAVIAGDKSMVELLVKAGAEVDAVPHAHKPDSRHTPMYLVPEGCGDIAQLLVDHGADVNRTTLSEGSKAMREVLIANGAGGSPLLRALSLGELDNAAAIIRDDPSVIHDRLPNASIDTPLHMAAKAGSIEIAELLLDRGMDVDTLSSRGKTALATAPEVYCSLDMFKILVERGADIHFNNDFPLKAAIWQHAYGHENYESVIRYLAGKGSRPRGLYDCAQGGNLSLAKLLLELGADVNETDRHGRTALDYSTGVAGEHQHAEIATLLSEHGGKLSADLSRGAEDEPKPMTDNITNLAKRGDFKRLKELWDSGQRFELATVFERAVTDFSSIKRKEGHQEILEFCIDQGLDPMTRADWMKQPLICTASMYGNEKIVEYIDQTVGLPENVFTRASLGDVDYIKQWATENESRLPELTDENGFNLLHYAVASGLGRASEKRAARQEATCRFLVDQQVSTLSVVENNISLTPALLCAWYCGNPDVMRMLLSAGEIDVRELHQAVEFAFEPHQRSGKSFAEVAEVILQHGFDINSIRPDQGRTLLHGSSNRGSTAAVDWLLKNGADPNVQDDTQQTSLHVAAIRNTHTSVVQKLLEHGVKLHAKNAEGKTALDLAKESGRGKVEYFLSNWRPK